jgi:RNA polymerase sigma-70 factor (ECF subfamily)
MTTLKSMSDEQLVKLFTEGNNRAFDTLLLRYKSFLYSHVYSITKDYDESNDILQEAYVRMISSLRQKFYIETGKFKYWALRIAHNIAIDNTRLNKNGDIKCSCSEEFSSIVPTDYYDKNIEDDMVDRQIKKQIYIIYKSLPEAQRNIVQMRYYNNLSFKEISNITGESINTSLGRMRYAILNMRKMANERKSLISA